LEKRKRDRLSTHSLVNFDSNGIRGGISTLRLGSDVA
jgi:hypothetical protein